MNAQPGFNAADMEKYSSAMTLSDMEIFIFPELLYSLLLANLMSPRIWAWRDDPWFAKIGKMTPYRRVLRLKQFIIDHYEFNLDLDTWGLTTKEREIERFRPFIDAATLERSNALFGYEGDKYYFDLDIRRHFGLDKYNTNVIPYWKTETVEAMDAFRFKDGYATGAGECVSLATLYAAALFIVCGIPLDDIFLMGTPLHSQNFIDAADGVLTNNRRVVTKNMWFNGTELTAKAQRALRHEQVTIVAHRTGLIHVVYPEATIRRAEYDRFKKKLRAFLTSNIDLEILANYLRQNSQAQKCFQLVHTLGGKQRYIPAERVYHYEHTSSFKVGDATRDKLLEEIDEDEYFAQPIEGRIPFNKFEDFFKTHKIDMAKEDDLKLLAKEFNCYNIHACEIIRDILKFTRLDPRLPDTGAVKTFTEGPVIDLEPGITREDLIARLESQRAANRIADLAFYTYRDLSRIDWAPFIKAALHRSPVAQGGAEGKTDDEVAALLAALPNESIYDSTRAAQPDEVWNYRRGDGFERALCLASILKARHPDVPIRLSARPTEVELAAESLRVTWPSSKGYEKELTL